MKWNCLPAYTIGSRLQIKDSSRIFCFASYMLLTPQIPGFGQALGYVSREASWCARDPPQHHSMKAAPLRHPVRTEPFPKYIAQSKLYQTATCKHRISNSLTACILHLKSLQWQYSLTEATFALITSKLHSSNTSSSPHSSHTHLLTLSFPRYHLR